MVPNLIVFNKSHVSALERLLSDSTSRIPPLKDKKAALEKKIQPTLSALNIAKSQLETQKKMIESTKSLLRNLELTQSMNNANNVRVSADRHSSLHGNTVRVSTEQHSKTFVDVTNDVSRILEISRLRSNLSEMESTRSNIEFEINKLSGLIWPDQQIINSLSSKIASLEHSQNRLSRECADAKTFLKQLQSDPDGLFESITGPLLINLDKYGKSNKNHRHAVRICLLQFEEKVKFLCEGSVTTKSGQERFAQLCGLLWSTHNHLKSQLIETKFISLFQEAILSTHIDQDGDLPDEFALGQSCKSLYHDLQKQQVKELGDMSVDHLLASEQALYQNALGKLKALLDQIRLQYRLSDDFDRKANDVIALIEAKKRVLLTQDPKDSEGTLNYYTKILTQTYQLASDPSNRQLQKAYKELANDFPGAPSTQRKLGGAMLAFLGVVVFVASVLLIPTTLTPMIYIGVVSGVGLFAAGAALYKSGIRDNDSRVIMDYANAAGSLKEHRSQPSFFDKPVKQEVSHDMANDKAGPVPVSATA